MTRWLGRERSRLDSEQRWANSVLRTEYEYEYYSSSKKWPNTNTNIIRFEKITRIRIRILFGLKKSPEYEYEYYSVWKYQPNTNTNILVFEYYSNNIQIPNYSLTSGIKACKGTLLCSKTKYKGIQKDNLFPESPNKVYFLLVPTPYVPSVVEWMIKSLKKVKVRVKTSHLIFG